MSTAGTRRTPGIAPITPPFDAELQGVLDDMMGSAEREPLALFRTIAHNRELARAFTAFGGYFLRRGLLSARERELVILRVCALTGAEYEWGVHARIFARRAGIDDADLAATIEGQAMTGWSEREQAAVEAVEGLVRSAEWESKTRERLLALLEPPELLEYLFLVSHYRGIATVIRSLGVELEPWARRFEEVA